VIRERAEIIERAVRNNATEKPEIHGVDPEFASRPCGLTENPYKILRVDPDSGSTLCISG
jgi:hypothetical protein